MLSFYAIELADTIFLPFFRVKLKQFKKFKDTTEALAATTAAVEGKLTKSLKKVTDQVISSHSNR